MADDINNDSLLELYLYESSSLLDSLDDILLSAEEIGNLSDENVNEIFRIMHTIKGSSAMMAYTGIADVSHKTEDLFAVIRNSGLNAYLFNELFDVVLAVSDFLKTEVNKVQEGLELETEIEPLIAVLLNLTEKMREGTEEEPALDLGRMLGGQPPEPEPVPEPPMPEPIPEPPMPEPVNVEPDLSLLEEFMPEAPEGGRMLGAEPDDSIKAANGFSAQHTGPDIYPEPVEAPEVDELAADISKVTSRAAEVVPDGRDTFCLHIYFNEGSKMENIRAFMLINKLNEKGTVNRTVPPSPEVDPNAANAIIEHGFYVSYTTTLFREQIETLVKGTLSVESVSFVRRLPDDAGADEPPVKAPKPEPRPQPTGVSAGPAPSAPAAPAEPEPQPAPEPVQQPEPQWPRQPEPQQQRQPEPMSWNDLEPQEQVPPPQFRRPVFIDVTKQQTEPPAPADIPREPLQPEPEPEPPAPPKPQDISPAAESGRILQEPQPPARPAQIEQTQSAISHANQNIISVELKKLDALLDLVGEIVINESIVTQNPELEGLELTNFNKAAHQLDKLTNELQDTVMSIRMLPVAIVFQRMRRIVRDMTKSLGKEANLILVGEATEVDKTILDALSDPIMHLIRNAMDHAIETPAERADAGKSVNGHIILSAQNSGGDVIISISDDGRGLNKDVILSKARARGLLRKPENEYSDREIYNIMMAPGFSTKEDVSEFSGRGVGLDVVKSNIEKIGGSVTIESKLGLGTNIIMKIPLTLAIISCMEIVIGKEIYSIPINNIRESFKASAGQIITDPTGVEMIMLRGQAYPIIRLYDTFGCDCAVTNIEDGILVLVDAGDHNACILADSLVGKFQVVVKPLPLFLNRFGVKRSGISGCTIMGTGNISLIINVQELVD